MLCGRRNHDSKGNVWQALLGGVIRGVEEHAPHLRDKNNRMDAAHIHRREMSC